MLNSNGIRFNVYENTRCNTVKKCCPICSPNTLFALSDQQLFCTQFARSEINNCPDSDEVCSCYICTPNTSGQKIVLSAVSIYRMYCTCRLVLQRQQSVLHWTFGMTLLWLQLSGQDSSLPWLFVRAAVILSEQ